MTPGTKRLHPHSGRKYQRELFESVDAPCPAYLWVAQSVQAGKLSCNKALCLLWHSFTYSPQPSLDSPQQQPLIFLSICRKEASGLDGLSHMGAEEGPAPVQVLGL